MNEGILNTDRELWRGPDEGNGSFYADSIHVTKGGGIGINVGGHAIVKPLRDWHAQAIQVERQNELLKRWVSMTVRGGFIDKDHTLVRDTTATFSSEQS